MSEQDKTPVTENPGVPTNDPPPPPDEPPPDEPNKDYSVTEDILKGKGWSEEDETFFKNMKEEEREANRELLKKLKKNLNRLRLQKAGYDSLNVPIHILNQIEDCEKEIRRLEKEVFSEHFSTAREDQYQRRMEREVSSQFSSSGEVDIQELSSWFKELPTEEKFYVVILSIFSGIRYPDFKQIHETLVIELKIKTKEDLERKSLDDYFGTADDERLEMCRAKTQSRSDTREEIIKFKNDNYPGAIFSLLRIRSRNLLFDLLPTLKKVGEAYRDWGIRFRAGLAVAEIGKLGFIELRDRVLDPWATDQRAYVRAAVGYPLAHLARDGASRKDVRDLLETWGDPSWGGSKNTWWRYRWTAASTYKQIGLIGEAWAKQWAYEGLRRIAGYDDTRLVYATMHSLIVLSLQGQLESVLLAIKEWIDEFLADYDEKKESARRLWSRYITSLLAFKILAEMHTGDIFTEIRTDEEEEGEDEDGIGVGNLLNLLDQSRAASGEVWQLAITIGVSNLKLDLADNFIELITLWTEYAAGTPLFQSTVFNLVAEVFIKLEASRDRQLLWNLLRRWEKASRDEDLANMAASARTEIRKRLS